MISSVILIPAFVLSIAGLWVGGTAARERFGLLVIALFAVIVLMVVGASAILGGVMLALAEATEPVPDKPLAEVRLAASTPAGAVGTTAAGIPALVAGLVPLVTELGKALKDLKASSAMALVGTILMIFGGAIAWNTIPGTNLNPTVTSPTEPASTPTGSPASADPSEPADETGPSTGLTPSESPTGDD